MTSGILLDWLDKPVSNAGIRFLDQQSMWRRHTYDELAGLVNGMATRLLEAGLRRGDIVPIMVPAGPEFVASFFGVLCAGGTPTVLPLRWALQDADGHVAHLSAIAAVVQPRIGIATPDNRDTLAAAGADELLILDPEAPAEFRTVRRAPAELALLQFTSGSRGRPRGVRLPWESVQANLAMIQEWNGLTTHGGVSWLPLYHDMGLIGGLLSPLTKQVEHAMMRPEHFIRSPVNWLMEYGTGQYPSMCMPNFGFARVLRTVRPLHLEGADFSHVHTMISGAERIDPAVFGRWLSLLEPFGFRAEALAPAYGLAEATLAVTGVRRNELATMVRVDGVERELGQKVKIVDQVRVSSVSVADPRSWHVGCGRPLPGIEVRLIDDDGTVLGNDLLGEIMVRGPSVADGYTEPGDEVSPFADGWLRTGDAAFRHDGELFVVGRLGDRVKINGRSVFVEDIEIELSTFGWAESRRLAVIGGVFRGRTTIVVLIERNYREHLELITKVVGEFTGPNADIIVWRVRAGGIPVTSSGKPRRRVAWTRYLTGQLGGAALTETQSVDEQPGAER
ncbi:MAG: AMP-binding protein [Pseudonocardiaceae bacterium]